MVASAKTGNRRGNKINLAGFRNESSVRNNWLKLLMDLLSTNTDDGGRATLSNSMGVCDHNQRHREEIALNKR